MALLEGKVAVIVGAGQGIGRDAARFMAKLGARIVVNDPGGASGITRQPRSVAEEIALEIRNAGGQAVANFEDASEFRGARRIIECALDNFGKLNVLVSNPGLGVDQPIFNMTEQDFDSSAGLQIKSAFNLARQVCAYWKEQHRSGNQLNARFISVGSNSGLFCAPGNVAKAVASAGVTALTTTIDLEMAHYGVCANTVIPVDGVSTAAENKPGEGPLGEGESKISGAPVTATLLAWLSSNDAREIHHEVFRVGDGHVWIMRGWQVVGHAAKNGESWDPSVLGSMLKDELAKAADASEEAITALRPSVA